MLLQVAIALLSKSPCLTAVPPTLPGEEAVGRRRWAEQIPEAVLDILTQGELEASAVTAGQTLPLCQGALQEEEKPDEERAEPRSDDEDT